MASVERWGSWASPLTATDAAAGSVRVGDPGFVGDTLCALASAPDGSGRMALMAFERGLAPREVSPPDVHLGSRLYLYGAGAWCATERGIVAIESRTQRLGMVTPDSFSPLESARSQADDWRHGDLAAVPGSSWVLYVRERPSVPSKRRQLVAESTKGGPVVVLRESDGCIAELAVSADASGVAWIEWAPPAMPWDEATVYAARLAVRGSTVELADVRRVDGGPRCSTGQPTWLADGSLAYVSEAAGCWQPWVVDPMGAHRRRSKERFEFQRPRWETCRWLAALGTDGTLAVAFSTEGVEHVGVLRPDNSVEMIDQPCVRVDGIAANGSAVGWVGATTQGKGQVAVARIDGDGAPVVNVLVAALAARPAASAPSAFSFTHDGHDVHGSYQAPLLDGVRGPDAPPPLVVTVHPGPTGQSDASYAPLSHLLTSSGFAVASVDYSGSTGYGRDHRERLNGSYGVLDVAECVAAAQHLADFGLADRSTLCIRGTSSGATTALLALTAGVFIGAVAWYPASRFEPGGDDFESGYLASLLGCSDEEGWAIAHARSPGARVAEMHGSVLVVQGTDDAVIDPKDTAALVAQLRGVLDDVAYVEVHGEGHGFRTRDGRARALEAELAFYRRLCAVPGPAARGRYDATTARST